MQSRDLANERQAEPSAFWITGEAIKRRKHLRALRGRDAGPAIGHLDHDHGAHTTQVNPHRRLAMTLGILEEVADHPAQQTGIAANSDRLAFEFAIIAGAFLGGEREQIDLFACLQRTDRLDLARQQDFVDQPVELGDVALQVGGVFRVGLRLHQLDAESDA